MDTIGLLQPSAKDKRIKGGQSFKNQSKLLELSLNFESNPWHDLMNVYFLRVIPPCILCMNPRKTQQWYQRQVLCHGMLLLFDKRSKNKILNLHDLI